GESDKCLAGLEIPRLILHVQPDNPKPGLLTQSAILLRHEMHIWPSKALEVTGPAFLLTHLLDDVFQAFALAARDHPQQRSSSRLQGRSDRAKGRLLLRNPVEGIEGNNELEFVPVGQTTSIGHLEAEVRLSWGTEAARREGDHVPRRIDAEPGAPGKPR